MAIHIQVVSSKKDLHQFIHLPAMLHRGHENWVPPLYADEYKFYNPKKNSSFQYCDCILALAFDGNKPAGRIMGIINNKYNESHHEKNARFFNMECENRADVSEALLKYIENWAKEKGMEKLIGPLGFSEKDPQGLMIEGFEQPSVIATACNQKYMVGLIEQYGFRKEVDCVSYQLEIPKRIPSFYEEIKNRTLERNHIHLLEFTSRRKLKPYIKPVFQLINEAYRHIFAFSYMSSGEIDFMVNRYLPMINPKYVKIVTSQTGEVVGFLLGMPDVAAGIRLAKGKLFPTGIFKILNAIRKTKLLVMMLGAIKQEYRNYGLDAVLGFQLLKEAKKAGMERIDSHLVLEDNLKMRSEYERLGGVVYKRYRIYQKELIG